MMENAKQHWRKDLREPYSYKMSSSRFMSLQYTTNRIYDDEIIVKDSKKCN